MLVVVRADVTRLCRGRGMGASGGVAGALMTGGTVLAAALGDPLLLLAAPAGVGAAAAGYGIGVKYYRTLVETIEVALEALLDELEGRPGSSS